MKLFCIDPGTHKSAYVLYDTLTMAIYDFGIVDNHRLLRPIQGKGMDRLVIEMIKSYGNIMGDSTINTCVWIGRFIQAWPSGVPIDLVPRKTIVTTLCGHSRAKDSNVRAALIERFQGAYDGFNGVSVIGTKLHPGPLYGIKKDLWSALAIAVTWQEVTDNMLG